MSNDRLSALRNRFIERLADDAAHLQANGEAAGAIAHKIAGAAGVFGFHELGRLAAEVDDQVHETGAAGQADIAALLSAIAEVTAPGSSGASC